MSDAGWKRPLIEQLALRAEDPDRFRAALDGFGGTTLGCAARAAASTCEERSLISLHSFFLRPVLPDTRAELHVERVRDGRRFAHRRVSVVSDGRLLCEVMASFGVSGEGLDYQEPTLGAGTPGPENLPDEAQIAREDGFDLNEPGPLGGPLEFRWIGVPWRNAEPGTSSRYRAWVRPREKLAPDPATTAGVLAYLCDYHSHFPTARQLGGNFAPVGITSLDQKLWVHRDLHWGDWRLLDSESDIAHGGRALARRRLFERDGRLVATMAQEQLVPSEVSNP